MRSPSLRPVELRRGRPLLGTLVEIRVSAPTAAHAERALCAGFAAVEKIQSLMSFHDAASDVSRLNRLAAYQSVAIDRSTCTVLRRAMQLHRASGGLFDIAIAPALVRGGWLPRANKLPRATSSGSSDDLVFLPGYRIRFRRPLQIDLGGIAKGFAVDVAIAALRRHGAIAGTANAGGDLRTFGPTPEPVHVRLPESPGELMPLTTLRDGAIATSAHYFSQRTVRGIACSPIYDAPRRCLATQARSVSVQAPECWLADALCKVVWLAGADALPLLLKLGARAWVFEAGAATCPAREARRAA